MGILNVTPDSFSDGGRYQGVAAARARGDMSRRSQGKARVVAPFDGVIANGAVWGRGSIDDKGSLVTLFEALETVAASGFKPVRTVIIVSGHDEEVRGEGLMLGMKAKVPNTELLMAMRDEYLLGVPAGDNVIRLLPPLILSREEADFALERLEQTCDAFGAAPIRAA